MNTNSALARQDGTFRDAKTESAEIDQKLKAAEMLQKQENKLQHAAEKNNFSLDL